MVHNLQCVLSAGPDLRVSCEDAGDGSIRIVIRRASDVTDHVDVEGSLHSESSQWDYSRDTKSGVNKITFTHRAMPVDRYDPCSILQRRIEDGWADRLRIVEEHQAAWTRDPTLFFGRTDFTSSAQWSAYFLDCTERKLSRGQRPFHLLNLYNYVEVYVRKAQAFDVSLKPHKCRMALIPELYPSSLTTGKQRSSEQRFRRHWRNGQALSALQQLGPGLLLTVAPLLPDAHYVEYATDLSWLSEAKREQSKCYDDLSVRLLSFMREGTEQQWDDLHSQTPGTSALLESRLLLAKEQSVELNGLQGRRTWKLIASLIFLSHGFKDESIPITALYLLSRKQRRWNHLGEAEDVDPAGTGICDALVKVLSHEPMLEKALKEMSSRFLLVEQEASMVFTAKSWRQNLWNQCPEKLKRFWLHQASAITRYVTPRGESLCDSYHCEGLLLAKHLLYQAKTCPGDGTEHAYALLAVIPFVDHQERDYILSFVDNLGTIPDDLALWHARHAVAKLPFHEIARTADRLAMMSGTPRLNAQRGRVFVACAERYMRSSHFAMAENLLKSWTPLNIAAPSRLEYMTHSYIILAQAELKRIQGGFQGCIDTLRDANLFYCAGVRRREINLLSDAYIEVGQPSQAMDLLEEHYGLFFSEADKMQWKLRHAESQIWRSHQGWDKFAEKVFAEARELYEAQRNRMGQAQALMGLARVAHLQRNWDVAQSRWSSLLHLLDSLGWRTTTLSAIAHLSVAETWFHTNNVQQHIRHSSMYTRISGLEGAYRYWFVGIRQWVSFLEHDRGRIVAQYQES